MKLSPYTLLITCFFALTTAAQDALESSDLGLVQQQIGTLELLADRARSSAADSDNPRYRFDYPRLAADLERVRHGINNYLSPSRAQPADMVELAGDYRAESLHSSPSNEHD
ncbi:MULTISPECIES: RAQPRD family integrative conjugative element protein [Pseudomonas]|uniref:RAQPRD family integrative conjugative element protein n=1 Tax=Pseudomonas taiwanensis TaxID=470150 RepID=A0A7L9GAS9_9PSED|nr:MULTISPECIES: RAQPRD family integrative conjugative element protein [Pseudomonas]MDD2146694.1 RAQPRD family integrative conjugative element protein [Pseudomonas putida]QOJ89494.1 RAQPRD family integrative conjugative element protein [Pseudomonas taiwanensis]WQQ35146.1 RAQPRD family integrative conjugative element protein [Pseudomonas putida]HDS1705658.1 RAQPRD family integrative conjugative element protein [Pseudomonas putida]